MSAIKNFPAFIRNLTHFTLCSMLLFTNFAFGDEEIVLTTPIWQSELEIQTEDGYAELSWALPDGEFAEVYQLSETIDEVTTVTYVDRPNLLIYRIAPGDYEFQVAACSRTPDGLGECAAQSDALTLIVPESVIQSLVTESDEGDGTSDSRGPSIKGPGISSQQTGPELLRPGLWYDPAKSGTGWSFYWANRLALPEGNPLYGNAYDLIGVWFTFEAKGLIQEDCTPTPCYFPDFYRPLGVRSRYSGHLS